MCLLSGFSTFFISKDCHQDEDKNRALSLPVVFNSVVVSDQVWMNLEVHKTLQEHNVLLLEPFFFHFVTIFQMIRIIDPVMAGWIAQLRTAVPRNWVNIVTQNRANNKPAPCLLTDRLFAGLLTPKTFTQLLLPKIRNGKARIKWQADLNCDIEPFFWDIIVRKSRLLFLFQLRDFHVQFLNRGFQYNTTIAKYRSTQSPMCDFCSIAEEMYVHLFWECEFVTPLWMALEDTCHEHVDMEDFTQFKCLMSNFQTPLTCILCTILKNFVHICKFINKYPTVFKFFTAVQKARDIHFKRCKA